MPAIEIIFFGLLSYLIARHIAWLPKYILVALISAPLWIVSGVYAIQMNSLWMSTDYVSVLAMENVQDIAFTMTPAAVTTLVLLASVWLAISITIYRTLDKHYIRPLRIWQWGTIAIVMLLFFNIQGASSRNGGAITLKPELAPVNGLVKTYKKLYTSRQSAESLVSFQKKVNDGHTNLPFTIDTNSDHPFRHKKVAKDLLPTTSKTTSLNLVVIFIEGMSARFMETYGSNIKGVMPHLDSHADNFLVIDNYYNHTAATFRGLIGQLSSGFPLSGGAGDGGWVTDDAGGKQVSICKDTVPAILADRNYETAFFSPHYTSKKLTQALIYLGFEKIFSADKLSNLIQPSRLKYTKQDTADKDIFKALQAYIEKRVSSDSKKPYMASIYNIGTHAFFDAPMASKKLKEGNSALNRFHYFDNIIGDFLDYFFTSGAAKNTILIVTSDHASFPEPPVVEALSPDPGYKPYFVDKIPLMIYAPTISLPELSGNEIHTSLDLAPTLLQLLGLVDIETSFLGHSLFDDYSEKNFPISAIGRDFYALTKDQGVIKMKNKVDIGSARENGRFTDMRNAIEYYYSIEKSNRLCNSNMR